FCSDFRAGLSATERDGCYEYVPDGLDFHNAAISFCSCTTAILLNANIYRIPTTIAIFLNANIYGISATFSRLPRYHSIITPFYNLFPSCDYGATSGSIQYVEAGAVTARLFPPCCHDWDRWHGCCCQ